MAPQPAKITIRTVETGPQVQALVAQPAAQPHVGVRSRAFAVWIGWCIVLLLPSTLAGVALKWSVVVAAEIHRLAAMMFRTHATLTFEEKLTFVRSDLLVGLLILPVGLAMVTWLLPKKVRFGLVALAGIAALVVQLLQSVCFAYVGKFLSWELARDAVQWGVAHPADMLNYIPGYVSPAKAGLALLALLATVAGVWFLYQKLVPRIRFTSRFTWLASGMFLRNAFAALLLLYGITALTWAVPVTWTAYHAPLLTLTVRALVDSEEAQFRHLASTDAATLQRDYRELSQAPPSRPSAYFGAARGYDVLLFIMETGPAACLDMGGDLRDFPSLRSLRDSSWVATRHYTTYPITNKAVFSIYASMYPSSGARYFNARNRSVPSVFWSAKSADYASGMYLPSSITFGYEKTLNRMMGVDKTVIADSGRNPAEVEQGAWHAKLDKDRAALAAMQQDIREWTGQGKHYVAAYLPQIAHGPWVDVVSGGAEQDVKKRGHNLMALQDKLLGELIETVRQSGRLDRTLIVVTSDHGIRTAVEDPSFKGGRLSDYTFHVPLMLYAPGVLHARQDIGVLTSHIDVAPSVLDLLGISEGRATEQGSQLWDPRIAGRRTFFWAKDYLGADGYYSDGKFGMLLSDLEAVYQAPALDFSTADMLRGERADTIRSTVRKMAATHFVYYNRTIR
jgi:membrane-anchored protein YejM (alkaline phosphatase superfamily)